MKTKKISVIILDYMKGKRVVSNVESLLNQKTDFEMEICVIDNSVNKENREILETLKKHESVKLIFTEKNIGYTKANNLAAKSATGELIFIVNPDIFMQNEFVAQKLVDYMDANPDVAIVAPKQIDENTGNVSMTVRAFPRLYTQVSRRTFLRNLPILKGKVAYDEMRHLDYSKTQEVDWLQSSYAAIRKDFWDEVGGFCEDYFLFMSDPHICFQAWERGKKVIYYPEAVVYADGIRVSSGGFKAFFKKWTLRQHLYDSIKYRIKHFFKANPRLKQEKR